MQQRRCHEDTLLERHHGPSKSGIYLLLMRQDVNTLCIEGDWKQWINVPANVAGAKI